MDDTKRLLIVDALNMYFRAYIVNPTLSTNGQPIGGTVGFLKILQKLCRETRPDEVIICWDGEGGSQKRKTKNKGYKEGRKPIRLNRDIRNLSENEEIANKIWQQTRQPTDPRVEQFAALQDRVVQVLFEKMARQLTGDLPKSDAGVG